MPRIRLLKEPSGYLPAFDAALKNVVLAIHDVDKFNLAADAQFYVGLRGSFGDHHVNPRTLRANMLGRMISIEGIVTRCKRECRSQSFG
jgi:DNA replication licensing factor MCM3